MSLKITRSSRNVFCDLGFDVEEAEHLKIRADLMIQVQERIAAGRYKQAAVKTIWTPARMHKTVGAHVFLEDNLRIFA